MKWSIEKFQKQCTIKELWGFIEDSLGIRNNAYPMYWITERKLGKLRKKGNIFLAMKGQSMIGCIIVENNYVEILCIKKKYRRKGIGNLLLNHIETKWRRDKRRKRILVDSVKDFKAKGFYEKMGYRVTEGHLDDSYTWHFEKVIA